MGAASSAPHRRRTAPSQAALVKRAALADDARVLEVRSVGGYRAWKNGRKRVRPAVSSGRGNARPRLPPLQNTTHELGRSPAHALPAPSSSLSQALQSRPELAAKPAASFREKGITLLHATAGTKDARPHD